jgi:hypothetical protein
MTFHLAQLNVGRLLHLLDHPQIKEFMDGLDHINALAEQSPGFVWRLQTESGNATDVHHPWSQDPFALVNLSVWKSAEDLRNFVYRSGHLDYYLKRSDWFEKPDQAHYGLWWVPEGHIPSLNAQRARRAPPKLSGTGSRRAPFCACLLDEARGRLEHYRAHGASPHAFRFGKLFPAPAIETVPV